MIPLVITTTIRESLASIAGAICEVWESDVDTPAVYAEQCRVHQADLQHSVMAFTPDGQLVGIGILCRRGQHGYVLDFGIVPGWRGQGLGHQVFAALVAQAREAGIAALSLVVRSDNVAAQSIYRKAGFETVRTLETLRGKRVAFAPAQAREVTDRVPEVVQAWFGGGKSGHPGWERDLPSILAMADARVFEVQHALMMVRPSPYFRRLDIVQLALDAEATQEDVNALMHAAGEAFDPRLPFALVDEPPESRAHRLLLDLGFRVVERNFEMKLTLQDS
ncbi:MAG: hypothetical protein Kow0077_07610 [Anaerolineae bacterium]